MRMSTGGGQMAAEQVAVKSCDKCVRKAVCIPYHCYTKLELKCGIPSSLAPELVVTSHRQELLAKGRFDRRAARGQD